jgi:hypothetical protein
MIRERMGSLLAALDEAQSSQAKKPGASEVTKSVQKYGGTSATSSRRKSQMKAKGKAAARRVTRRSLKQQVRAGKEELKQPRTGRYTKLDVS